MKEVNATKAKKERVPKLAPELQVKASKIGQKMKVLSKMEKTKTMKRIEAKSRMVFCS